MYASEPCAPNVCDLGALAFDAFAKETELDSHNTDAAPPF